VKKLRWPSFSALYKGRFGGNSQHGSSLLQVSKERKKERKWVFFGAHITIAFES
jgi:hypothetical protein